MQAAERWDCDTTREAGERCYPDADGWYSDRTLCEITCVRQPQLWQQVLDHIKNFDIKYPFKHVHNPSPIDIQAFHEVGGSLAVLYFVQHTTFVYRMPWLLNVGNDVEYVDIMWLKIMCVNRNVPVYFSPELEEKIKDLPHGAYHIEDDDKIWQQIHATINYGRAYQKHTTPTIPTVSITGKRFAYVPVNLTGFVCDRKLMGHANALVVDRKNKKVWFIEPHGFADWMQNVEMYIQQWIEKNLPGFTLEFPGGVCPSFQSNRKVGIGDCSIWSLFLSMIVMLNPDKDPMQTFAYLQGLKHTDIMIDMISFELFMEHKAQITLINDRRLAVIKKGFNYPPVIDMRNEILGLKRSDLTEYVAAIKPAPNSFVSREITTHNLEVFTAQRIEEIYAEILNLGADRITTGEFEKRLTEFIEPRAIDQNEVLDYPALINLFLRIQANNPTSCVLF